TADPTLSLHDALPIFRFLRPGQLLRQILKTEPEPDFSLLLNDTRCPANIRSCRHGGCLPGALAQKRTPPWRSPFLSLFYYCHVRSEEHTSELQSSFDL